MLKFSPSRDRGKKFAERAEKATQVGSSDFNFLTGKICWTSAIECAKLSGAISAAAETRLKTKADGGNADSFAPVGAGAQVVAGPVDFLLIPPGCFIAFCGGSFVGGGTRVLSHVMVSLGNGKAAGSNNGLIDGRADWHTIQVDARLNWNANLAQINLVADRDYEIRVIDLDGIDAAMCVIM
jgi:hypothetical protein